MLEDMPIISEVTARVWGRKLQTDKTAFNISYRKFRGNLKIVGFPI